MNRKTSNLIVVDFRARAKPVQPQETPATVHTLNQAKNAQLAYELYVQASAIDTQPDRYDDAAALYGRAIALDPSMDVAYTNLGNIYVHRRHEARAISMYLQALHLNPRQPEAHYNLGYIHLQHDEYEMAVKCFQRSLEADPTFVDAHFNCAMALQELGDDLAAVAHWRTVVRLDPGSDWAEEARQQLARHARRATVRPATTLHEPSATPAHVSEVLDGMADWLAKQRGKDPTP